MEYKEHSTRHVELERGSRSVHRAVGNARNIERGTRSIHRGRKDAQRAARSSRSVHHGRSGALWPNISTFILSRKKIVCRTKNSARREILTKLRKIDRSTRVMKKDDGTQVLRVGNE